MEAMVPSFMAFAALLVMVYELRCIRLDLKRREEAMTSDQRAFFAAQRAFVAEAFKMSKPDDYLAAAAAESRVEAIRRMNWPLENGDGAKRPLGRRVKVDPETGDVESAEHRAPDLDA